MPQELRKTGVDIIGDAPWASHFCQFYDTKQDLLDILVPYFKAGLENNEFCMWVTAPPLSTRDAEKAMRAAMPDFDSYLEKKQIEIVPHDRWYDIDGVFDGDRVLSGWVLKLDDALARGFDGLRLTGNTTWLERKDRADFREYEAAVNSVIGKYKMLVLCTYRLNKCTASDVLDVMKNHEFAIVRQNGEWNTIESTANRQVKEELAASERRYRQLIETTSEGVWVAGTDGKTIYVNQRMADMLGLTVAELLQSRRDDFFAPDYYARAMAIRKQRESGVSGQYELKLLRKDGSPLWVLVSGSPVYDEDGKHIANLGMHKDITGSKAAEGKLALYRDHLEDLVREHSRELVESEEKFRNLVENAPVGMAVSTKDGRTTSRNNYIARMLGYDSPEELAKVPITETYADPADRTRMLNLAAKGLLHNLEIQRKRKDGALIWTSQTGVPLGSGGDEIIYVSYDVTARKQAEDELATYREHLEELVRQRTAELEKANLDLINEITERKQAEAAVKLNETRMESLIRISQYRATDVHDILDFALNEAAKLSGSTIGYIYRYDEEKRQLILSSWSKDVAVECAIVKPDTVYDLDKTGIWGEVIRQKQAVIVNNYDASNPLKKGYPAGHARLNRWMGIPVVQQGKIVATLGLANKAADYDSADVQQLTLLMDSVWNYVERQRVEEALTASEERYRSIIETANEGIFIADLDGRLTFVNERFADVLGYQPGEMGGRPTLDFIAPEFYGSFAEQRSDREKGISDSWEMKFRRKDGAGIWVISSGTPLYDNAKKHYANLSMITDINDRKQAEEALKESEEKYRQQTERLQATLDAAPAIIWTAHDRASREITSNQAGNDFLRVKEGTNVSKTGMSPELLRHYRVYKDGAELLPENMPIQRVAATGKELRDYVMDFVFDDGSSRSVEGNVAPLLDTAGQPAGAVAVFIDITERKAAEEALEASEEKYRRIIETAYEGVWITDDAQKTTFVNRRMADVLGYTIPELMGRFSAEFMDEEQDQITAEIREKLMAGLHTQQELKFRKKDGSFLWAISNASPVTDAEGNFDGIISLLTDITQRRQVEEELRASRRFLEIGIRNDSVPALITEFVREIRDITGCEAAGIRLLDGSGMIPYIESEGFTKQFLEQESPLSVKTDRCMCSNVINRTTDPSQPYYTPFGSFYSNGTTGFLNEASTQLKAATRNVCNAAGFESVALVPIRAGSRVIGLVHIADHKENMVPLPIVTLLERASATMGIGIQHVEALEALRTSEERYRQLVETASEGIWVVDTEGVTTYANQRLADTLGYTREELVGKMRTDFILPEDVPMLIRLRKDRQKGLTSRYESRFIRKDGAIIWMLVSGSPIFDAAGKHTGNLGMHMDVTESKLAEDSLRKSEERNRTILQTAMDGFWVVDTKGRLLEVNQTYCRMSGYSESELLTMAVPDIEVAEAADTTAVHIQKIIAKGEDRFESRHRRKDGTVLNVEISVQYRSDEGGRFVAFLKDIDDRKRAEAKLEEYRDRLEELVKERTSELVESEARFRNLVENAPVGISIITLDGRAVFRNRRIAEMGGYTPEEVERMPVSERYLKMEDRRRFLELVKQGGVRGFETELRGKNGEHYWVSMSGIPQMIEFGQGVIAITEDITERKRAEERIRYLATFPELNPTIIVELDDRGNVRYANPAMKDLFPNIEQSGIGHPYLAGFDSLRKAVRDGGDKPFPRELQVGDAWYEQVIHFLTETKRYRIYGRDITVRKKAIEELRNAALYARGLIEASLDPLVTINAIGKITDVNQAAESAIGVKRDELVGTVFSDYFTEPEKARESYQQVFARGFVRDYPLTVRHVSGKETNVLYNATVFRNEDGEVQGVVAVARDVTHLKQLENDLRRSNSDLQQFAYITSHDLQEPLRMITSYLQLLERRYKSKLDSDADEFIGYAVDGAARMRTMIGDLLEYSRVETRGKPMLPTSTENALAAALSNLEVAIKENGATVTHDPLPVVKSDPTQLIMLFQNLVGNGVKFHGKEAPCVHVSAVREGKEWRFAVRDNGIGIEPQYFSRLFQVFQRLHTRDEYPGTGIGLALCKRIVERHGGRIWVESEAGRGTTFYFTIPVGGQ